MSIASFLSTLAPDLEQRLSRSASPQEAQGLLAEALAKAANPANPGLEHLTALQARIMLHLLQLLRSLLDLHKPAPAIPPPNAPRPSGLFPPGEVLIAAGGGAVIGSLIGGPMGMVIGSLGGIAMNRGAEHFRPSAPAPEALLDPQAASPGAFDPSPHVLFLRRLTQTVDEILTDSTPPVQLPSHPSLADHPEVLRLLQRWLGATLTQDADPEEPWSREIRAVLRAHGIRAVSFDPAREESWSGFDPEPALDPTITTFQTILPVLRRGAEILLRGRVVEPKRDGGDDHEHQP